MRKFSLSALILVFGLVVTFQSSCYYDNEQSLYGSGTTSCDTTNLKYSTKISSLIAQNCTTCHSLNGSQSVQPMETYDELKAYALAGRIVFRTNDTLSPMPPTGLLSECDRNQLKAWVNAGAPQ
jgi:uncharacterized membrane protein